jgi:hypothetical protein
MVRYGSRWPPDTELRMQLREIANERRRFGYQPVVHPAAPARRTPGINRIYQRPHSALGYLTQAAYAANLTATCDRLRNPDRLPRSHVASPAPDDVKSAETLITTG